MKNKTKLLLATMGLGVAMVTSIQAGCWRVHNYNGRVTTHCVRGDRNYPLAPVNGVVHYGPRMGGYHYPPRYGGRSWGYRSHCWVNYRGVLSCN